MHENAKDELILTMLKIWYYIKQRPLVWSKVTDFLERRINEELE